VPKLIDTLKALPQIRDVASDLQNKGLQAFVDIDRDAASRLGVSVSAIDDALYDAFGQRLISTIYTQANQYRVVLEASPRYQLGPDSLGQIHVAASGTAQGGTAGVQGSGATSMQIPLSSIARIVERETALVINHAGQFPATTVSVQPGAGRVARRGRLGHRGGAARTGDAGQPADALPGRRGSVPLLARQHADPDPGGDRHDVHRAGRALRELHPPDHDPLDAALAGVGALLALKLVGTDLSLIAVIGIILLIGIVKKNAIMMIDFALDAERNDGMAPVDAIYQAALLRFRRS
jgi:multidrug efflux pump